MITINDRDIFNPFGYEWIGDILYLDGPYSILMRSREDKKFYIFDWCEDKRTHHVWMRYEIDIILLSKYIHKKINRRELVLKSNDKSFLLIEVSGTYDNLIYENIQIIDKNLISKDYLPTEDSFYDSDLCPDESKIRLCLILTDKNQL